MDKSTRHSDWCGDSEWGPHSGNPCEFCGTEQSLTDFLLARIAEDEAAANAASPSPWSYGDVASVAGGMLYDQTRTIAGVYYEQPEDHDGSIVRNLLVPEADANGRHIARHDPARVLAECEAKRRILTDDTINYNGGHPGLSIHGARILGYLALPYADHPDYRDDWRP